MNYRAFVIAVFVALTLLWAFLGHHYYTRLYEYAGIGYYLTHPVLYVGVEFMWLLCVVVLTWLCVRLIDLIRDEEIRRLVSDRERAEGQG